MSSATGRRGNAYVTGNTKSRHFPTLSYYQSDQPNQDSFGTVIGLSPAAGLRLANTGTGFSNHSLMPNPARDAMRVSFRLPAAATVTMEIYATDGRLVSRPVNAEPREAGTYSQSIPVDVVPPGMYTLRVMAGQGSFVERFGLLG